MIRILIVDDDPYIRESLSIILSSHADITVIGTCTNGDEALQFLQGKHDQIAIQGDATQTDSAIDVVLMDIRMPVCDGVEGTRLIKQQFPHIAILILTTFDDDDYIIEALKHGANGYMLKNVAPTQIIEGIKSVAQGNLLIHPTIAKKLPSFLQQKSTQTASASLEHYQLTPTEQSIIKLIAEGLSNKEISQQLFLGEGTIKNYITEILSKLSLRDRTQIAIFYLKEH